MCLFDIFDKYVILLVRCLFMTIETILLSNQSVEDKIKALDEFYKQELISKKEVADILGVALNSIDVYVRKGKLLPFISENRNILFKRSDVEAFKPEVQSMKKLFKR
ncbi:DNA-binding protein [Listeria monocytogenes]|nr:DNA-binding protein [Listeria monocytogenes]UCK61454.1 DNA-binding protein [Listeria innocua]EAC3778997.1 DNA-binding protein [Listeria monocytogenes]EAC4520808.1 DNA-binding protein [Listeria monocytogenes]EAC8688086.1 DNA-binding protein [Listeria monocytogenes]